MSEGLTEVTCTKQIIMADNEIRYKDLPTRMASENIAMVHKMWREYLDENDKNQRFGQYFINNCPHHWGSFACSDLFYMQDDGDAFTVACQLAEYFNPKADT